MTAAPITTDSAVHLETLEGVRVRVSRARHPATGADCLVFAGPGGQRLALHSNRSIAARRDRVWQMSVTDGASYTLGPVDMARLRKLAS